MSRRSTALKIVKTLVVAPRPRESATTAAIVSQRSRLSSRAANVRSPQMF
jgi:hypothetical protein